MIGGRWTQVLGMSLAAAVLCAAAVPEPSRAETADYVLDSITLWTTEGGRVDWSHDGQWIVFDRLEPDGFYDVYRAHPDGSAEECLTCDHPDLPNEEQGQPAFHPSGQYIVFQVEKAVHRENNLSSHPGKGIYVDLWAMDLSAGPPPYPVYQLTDVRDGLPDGENPGGILHAHFNHDGTKLLWGDLEDYNALLYVLGDWQIAVADFVTSPTPQLQNTTLYNPGPKPTWFETHGFSADESWLYFACLANTGQPTWNADICRMDFATPTQVTSLTPTSGDNGEPAVYDEHASLSPPFDIMVWGSDEFAGRNKMEWTMMDVENGFAGRQRVSHFHEAGYPEYIGTGNANAVDHAWNPSPPPGVQQFIGLVNRDDISAEYIYMVNFTYVGLEACTIAPLNPHANSTLAALPFNASAAITDIQYQWTRNGADIPGATDQLLEPQLFAAGDTVSVTCTPTDGTNVGTPRTDSVTIGSAPANAYNTATTTGPWCMVSAPLATGDHLSDDFDWVFYWDEDEQRYVGGTGATAPSTNPGEGYWGYVDPAGPDSGGGREVDGVGNEVPATDFAAPGKTVTAGGFTGRHMLGNPFNVPIYVQYIQASPAGAGTYTFLADAAANGWVENNAWIRYDNTAGQYIPLGAGSNDGKVYPWEAFWLRALVDVDLIFSRDATPPPPVSVEPATNPGEWSVTLKAVSGAVRDDFNTFGLRADANAGRDRYDISDPGTINDNHVVLSFGAPPEALASDFRPVADTTRWEVTVDTVTDEPVTLSWSEPPGDVRLTLVDGATGEVVALHSAQTYCFAAQPGTKRRFSLQAERIEPVGGSPETRAGTGSSAGGCTAADARTEGAMGGLILVVVISMLGSVWRPSRRRREGGSRIHG